MTTDDAAVTDFDSRPDTYEHIGVVRRLLGHVVKELLDRADGHDASKLVDPEREMFNEYTPKLKHSTYGSDEYKGFLAGMGDALQHHYANNRHHPEHHEDGILGMTLIDLVEMTCDWIAASQRHADGDPHRSIDVNQERLRYDDQIKRILHNTVDALEPRAEPGCPDVDDALAHVAVRLGALLGMSEDLVRRGIQVNDVEVVLEDLHGLLRSHLTSAP
jgi:hypothetical protein